MSQRFSFVVSAAVPLLLGTLLAPSRVEAAPAAPSGDSAGKSFDTSVPRPFTMTLRGVTGSEAWLAMEARDAKGLDEGVLDLKSGCIVETMAPFSRVARLGRVGNGGPLAFVRGQAADKTKEAEALIADPATKAELIRFVAAGRRFGQRRLGFGTFHQDDLAFSDDGQTMILESGEAMFRSRDGGRSFDRLDANMSRHPSATADGRFVFYERCADGSRRNQSCPEASREVRIVPSDGSASRTIAIGSGLLHGIDPTGQKLVVVRYDLPREVTVMHVDPAAGTMTRAFGIPSTPLPQNRFHDIEPSHGRGAFGLFDDNDKHPISVFTVVSMTDGKVVQRLSARNTMGSETDDESGRLMWQTYYDDHTWASRPGGAVRDLGMGDPLGWAPGGRALVFAARYNGGRRADDPPATLGAVACKLVRVTAVP